MRERKGLLNFRLIFGKIKIKMWDFRLAKPQIAAFNDQDDIISFALFYFIFSYLYR
jgi:hypothetical protein